MKQQEFEKLSRNMTIEVIVMDLADIMIPCIEGRPRAVQLLKQGHQAALNVKHRMGQALIVLEKLGYIIIKPHPDDTVEDLT